jgi:hypothetical protein
MVNTMIDLENPEQIKKISAEINKLVQNNESTLKADDITDDHELACIYGIISQKYEVISNIFSKNAQKAKEEAENGRNEEC